MRLVKLGLAAVNTTVGAFGANVDKALSAHRMAAQQVTVAVFPEQVIGGYPQEDLVQWQGFMDRQWSELERYARETAALPLVSCLGVGIAHQGLRYNCAAVVAGGAIRGLVPKRGASPPTTSSTKGAPLLAARQDWPSVTEGCPLAMCCSASTSGCWGWRYAKTCGAPTARCGAVPTRGPS